MEVMNKEKILNELKSEKYIQAKNLYLKGVSLTKIEQQLKYNRKRLSSLLKLEGIEIIKDNKKHKYNENYFKEIDMPRKAYWLGYLCADCSINNFGKYEMQLRLAEKDIEILKEFEKDILISETSIVCKYNSKIKDREYPSCELRITNKTIVNDLINKGCVTNKSTNLKFPHELSQHLIKHYIRGYFDGNGHSTLTCGRLTVGITSGNYSFLLEIERYLRNFLYLENKSQRDYITKDTRSECYTWQRCGKDFIIKLYKYLYDDADIYLKRKKNKFELYFKQNNIDITIVAF